MADNTELNTGSGGNTIATDDIGGIHYQRVKVNYGDDGSATDVSASNPLPCIVTNAGTFVAQIDGTALTRLTDIETNTNFGAVTGGGVEASALRVTIASDSTGVISIDDGGGAITVDGTVTANLSATDNAVLDTIATPVATISSTPLQRVAIFDGSDTQVTSFGGGTQYTEGDTDTTITGTAILWEDTGNALATVSSGSPLPVTSSALAATTDTVTAKLATDAIHNGTTALTPKFAAVTATAGANTIVAAVAGKKIRVLSYTLIADAQVGVAFGSGAAATDLTGSMPFAEFGGASVAFSAVGHFETSSNTLLNLQVASTANVEGHVCYVEV